MNRTGIEPHGLKFRACVSIKRKKVHLGLFDTVEAAQKAQDDYRKTNNLPEPLLPGRPKGTATKKRAGITYGRPKKIVNNEEGD